MKMCTFGSYVKLAEMELLDQGCLMFIASRRAKLFSKVAAPFCISKEVMYKSSVPAHHTALGFVNSVTLSF